MSILRMGLSVVISISSSVTLQVAQPSDSPATIESLSANTLAHPELCEAIDKLGQLGNYARTVADKIEDQMRQFGAIGAQLELQAAEDAATGFALRDEVSIEEQIALIGTTRPDSSDAGFMQSFVGHLQRKRLQKEADLLAAAAKKNALVKTQGRQLNDVVQQAVWASRAYERGFSIPLAERFDDREARTNKLDWASEPTRLLPLDPQDRELLVRITRAANANLVKQLHRLTPEQLELTRDEARDAFLAAEAGREHDRIAAVLTRQSQFLDGQSQRSSLEQYQQQLRDAVKRYSVAATVGVDANLTIDAQLSPFWAQSAEVSAESDRAAMPVVIQTP